jgi:hypothetical protein
MQPLQWTISQIGARQHYGVPLGFHYLGHLKSFYTDLWCRWGSRSLRQGPTSLRSFAGRFHIDLPSDKVHSFNIQSIYNRFQGPKIRETELIYREFLRYGTLFGRRVTQHLEKQSLDPVVDAFFGFNTGCLETLEMLRKRNILTIVDQIDPARVEEELVFQESEKWAGWQEAPGRIPEVYFERLSAEWAAATYVVVNSEWSKQALIAQDVAAEKLLVVPVAYEAPRLAASERQVKVNNHTPLIVLWIGTVNLRKGIQYLIGAARRLSRTNIQFIVGGPVEISEKALATAPKNITFLGRITRDQTAEYYRKAHVFVLPTISDGFAITQVEAMARGLPVITTPNCGQVVTHGIDGLIVAVGDEHSLAQAIAQLDSDRELLSAMSEQALFKSRTFLLPKQVNQIENAIRRTSSKAL